MTGPPASAARGPRAMRPATASPGPLPAQAGAVGAQGIDVDRVEIVAAVAAVAGAAEGAAVNVVAEGKNGGHIPSTNNCEDCHRTGAWSPVFRVDHGSVLGSCFSCHNGVVATGKHPGHVASSDDCSSCHTVTGWIPALP